MYNGTRMRFQRKIVRDRVRGIGIILALGLVPVVMVSTSEAAPVRARAAAKVSARTQVAMPDNPKYADFKAALDKMLTDQSSDYAPALDILLKATEDDDSVIMEWMKAAASQGSVAAERWLLNLKLTDIPLEKVHSPEVKEAYRGMLRLADKGYVPALLDVSASLRMGLGVAKDEVASQRKLMDACRGGNFLARDQWLAATKRISAFSDKDKPEVASEINRGNHYVMFRLANLTVDPATRNEWLAKAAKSGSAAAYFALSALVSSTKPKESEVLLREAVRLYNVDALYTLGTVLLSTDEVTSFAREAGITPDPQRGWHLLRLAAALGHPQSTMALGRAYYNGTQGLPQDYEKAYAYFSSPRMGGYAAVASARAVALLLGKGVKQDAATAVKLLERANKVGYPQATINLAYAYYKGVGVQADARRAADLLSEAATAMPAAYVYLAYITAKGGPGLPADPSQAKRFIRLASMDMGDRASQLYDSLLVKGEWELRP